MLHLFHTCISTQLFPVAVSQDTIETQQAMPFTWGHLVSIRKSIQPVQQPEGGFQLAPEKCCQKRTVANCPKTFIVETPLLLYADCNATTNLVSLAPSRLQHHKAIPCQNISAPRRFWCTTSGSICNSPKLSPHISRRQYRRPFITSQRFPIKRYVTLNIIPCLGWFTLLLHKDFL